jgi:hypothetical protein
MSMDLRSIDMKKQKKPSLPKWNLESKEIWFDEDDF